MLCRIICHPRCAFRVPAPSECGSNRTTANHLLPAKLQGRVVIVAALVQVRLPVQHEARGANAQRRTGDGIGQPMHVLVHAYITRRSCNAIPNDTANPSVFIAARFGKHRPDRKRGAGMNGREGIPALPPLVRRGRRIRTLPPGGVSQCLGGDSAVDPGFQQGQSFLISIMVSNEAGVSSGARYQQDCRRGIPKAVPVLAVEDGVGAGREVRANARIQRMRRGDERERAADIPPVLRVPAKRRCKIEFRILQNLLSDGRGRSVCQGDRRSCRT